MKTNNQILAETRQELIKNNYKPLIEETKTTLQYWTSNGLETYSGYTETWHNASHQVKIMQLLNDDNTIYRLVIER